MMHVLMRKGQREGRMCLPVSHRGTETFAATATAEEIQRHIVYSRNK